MVLLAGGGASFAVDDLYYFGRKAAISATGPVHYDSFSFEYIFVPHNGHAGPAGKLTYEALLTLFRTNYVAFRVTELLAVCICVVLFFELARPRVGAPVALLLSLLLILLGAAWEVLLWGFDMHTTFSLAAGLGALLLGERGGRWTDPIACLLLVVSLAFIEAGLSFVAAVAVSIVLDRSRWRSAWVFVVPLAVYGGWYLWAHQFDPISAGSLSNVAHLPSSLFDSLGAVLASLTGAFPTGSDVSVFVVGQSSLVPILAAAAVILLVVRLWAGPVPVTVWPLLAALLVYWVFIGLALRPPDSSRYMFVGSVLLLLVIADLVRGHKPGPLAIVIVGLLVAIALPSNLSKLFNGGDYFAAEAALTGGEFAMLELAGRDASPDYEPAADPELAPIGASPYMVLSIAEYREAAERIGSLADPLDQIRAESDNYRAVDDAVLARALNLRLEAPDDRLIGPAKSCRELRESPGVTSLPPNGVTLRALVRPSVFRLSRFVTDRPTFDLGSVSTGRRVMLALPGRDAADEPWNLYSSSPVEICNLRAGP